MYIVGYNLESMKEIIGEKRIPLIRAYPYVDVKRNNNVILVWTTRMRYLIVANTEWNIHKYNTKVNLIAITIEK